MDEVNAGRKEFLVTRRGVPVALMVPADEPSEPPDSIDREAPWPKDWPYPDLRHLVSYLGDVVTPIDLDWEAMR